ncbi:Flp1 family type IVb pilin [[Ruminococcus] torques]|nr:Flp1 family type IVb pilin [[Ruminococcus] torques]MDM8236026.1 Flp1 family type IVb pilin [[Ruminococcus] torques]
MNMAIINLKLRTASVFTSVKDRIRDFFIRPRYVSGITVIELVLILVIIIALLLIFKTQLINLINTIFDKITSESSGI